MMKAARTRDPNNRGQEGISYHSKTKAEQSTPAPPLPPPFCGTPAEQSTSLSVEQSREHRPQFLAAEQQQSRPEAHSRGDE